MKKYIKQYIKQLTAVVISLAVFFSLIPGSAVIKAEEEVKTTFPVYTLHKSGSDREICHCYHGRWVYCQPAGAVCGGCHKEGSGDADLVPV